jgi:hypothetical protein
MFGAPAPLPPVGSPGAGMRPWPDPLADPTIPAEAGPALRRAGFVATHPSLGARIDRVRRLEGLAPLDPAEAPTALDET